MPYRIGLQLRKHALNSLIEVELLFARVARLVQQSLYMPVDPAKFRLILRDVRITLSCLPFILMLGCPFVKFLISAVLILQPRFLA